MVLVLLLSSLSWASRVLLFVVAVSSDVSAFARAAAVDAAMLTRRPRNRFELTRARASAS